jgi:signal transduction histidine kinase
MSPQLLLNDPLPADAIAGMIWGPFRYRRYRVFSRPWLKWRFLISALAVSLYGCLVLFGQLVHGANPADAAITAAYFIIGFQLMFTMGPALATWVRYRRLDSRREGWAVVAAIVLGVVAAIGADAWASRGIVNALQPREVPTSERKIGDLDKALLTLATLGFGFVYFAGGGGLAAPAYFSERRRLAARSAHMARLETDMRLAVLQAQIEPHFLFNTLASIRPLIRQDAGRAEAAIDAFAAHLRHTIPQMRAHSGTAASTLGQQVDICASYLSLMHVRMDARLRSEIVVPNQWRALEFPPLMLLSLVENAIKHGLEPKPGPGWVRIQAAATTAALQVCVIDDGVGLNDGLSAGLGLSNIREQLAVKFAGRASLSVIARPEGGTMAAITIPLSTTGV